MFEGKYMVMLRAKDKAQKIAEKVLNNKGIKLPKARSQQEMKLKGPYLQHWGKMDKAIRKIEKRVKGTAKSLKSLEKMDKKHDKVVAKAKKMKKGKC